LRAPTPSAAAEMLYPPKVDLEYQIEDTRKRLDQSLLRQVEFYQQDLDEAVRRLESEMSSRVEVETERFRALAGRLEALSPLGCLARGYSITLLHDSDKLIKSVCEIKKGQEIRTRVGDGSFVSRIEEIQGLKKGS